MRMTALACAVALAGCATTPTETRQAEAPRVVVRGASFDGLNACVADAVVDRFKMRYLPTVSGAAYSYKAVPGLGGSSAMLVDIDRGTPPTATVRVSGGPWLGRDNRLIEVVEACAGR